LNRAKKRRVVGLRELSRLLNLRERQESVATSVCAKLLSLIVYRAAEMSGVLPSFFRRSAISDTALSIGRPFAI